jgi:hypothetical protein
LSEAKRGNDLAAETNKKLEELKQTVRDLQFGS